MYYTIENRTDKEVGNVYPQVDCINQDLAHSIQFDEFYNFDDELLFQLEPKAKLTDVLSQATISAHGLLVNSKVKDLLAGFKLMEHRYYKCVVKDLKGTNHDYYWLHLSDYTFLNKINYPNSKFYTLEYGFREDDITLISYDDYKIKKEQLGKMGGISSDFIKLNNNFDFTLDLFNIPIFGKSIYIKEQLAANLHKDKITGLLIEPTNTIE